MGGRFPTGRQLRIRNGPYAATITEVGGGLRELSCSGIDIVDGFAADAPVEGCRGQVLAPWPNRLRDGTWTWEGRQLQLPIDEPRKGNSASHGLVRWVPWTVELEEADRAALTYHLHPQPGYPFALDLRITYALSATDGLTVVLSASNPTSVPTPVALGMHPYLKPSRGGLIDDCALVLPANTRVLVDEWGSPVGTEPVADTPFDFREPRRIGQLAINSAFTDVGSNNRSVVSLTDVRGDRIELWTDSSCGWIQVFTGDSLSPGSRRRGIAIEPMTAPPNALASKEGVTLLHYRESLSLRWGLRANLGL
jgi:aldose 1-epimerase